MDNSRLSVVVSGAFLHPLGDQVPIDCRYSETLRSPRLPHKYLAYVDSPRLVDYGGLVDPRGVLITNLSGFGLQKYPDETELAKLMRCVLLVGPEGQECCELRPAVPGKTAQGTPQWFWLRAGVTLALRPLHDGVPVQARVIVFPGDAPD